MLIKKVNVKFESSDFNENLTALNFNIKNLNEILSEILIDFWDIGLIKFDNTQIFFSFKRHKNPQKLKFFMHGYPLLRMVK